MGGSSGVGQGQRKQPMPFNPNQGGQIAQLMPNQGGRNKPMPFNPNQGGQRIQPMPFNPNQGGRNKPMPFNPNQGGRNKVPFIANQGGRNKPMPFNPNQGNQRSQPMPFNPKQGGLAPRGNFNVNQAAAGGLQQAMQGTQAGMGFQAQEVDPTRYNAARAGQQSALSADQVQAGQLAGADLSAYTNPYESQVVDQSLADLERSRLMQQNQLGAQASAAGAFGGSRQGIAEAETNRAFADQAARTASGLRQAGFQNAQQMAGQDIATQMQASLANQGANLQAGTTSAQLAQQINMANQNALNQARQFGAQQGMTAQQLNQMAGLQANQQRLGAASQMGQLGQQAFGTGQAIQQQQMQQGLMQQGLQQALIDAARGQYAGFTGAPGQSLGLPLAALGATPNQSTTTQQKNPGLFDYLSLAASAAAGMPSSDIRLKKDIRLLGKANGHNIYSWEWTDEGKRIADPSQPKVGVMAQELQETHPHLVHLGADGYLGVDYSGLAAEAA
jgi:hypothetical protein